MDVRAGSVLFHCVEHGTGRPVLVLHGAGVDHREAEACFEPALDGVAGLRRIYPDLPGMGRTIAPETLCSGDDVLDVLLDLADEVSGGTAHLLIGHSAGAYYAQAMAARRPAQVAGLALVCPLVPGVRDVPEHRVVAGPGGIGDDDFRSYFVVQTPEMLDRYERHVAPAAALVDVAALERIGERWVLGADPAPAYPGADGGPGRETGLDGRVGRRRRPPRAPPARLARRARRRRARPAPRAAGPAARPARRVAGAGRALRSVVRVDHPELRAHPV